MKGYAPELLVVREATDDDLEAIRQIYNHGIEDRIATLDTGPKTRDEMEAWWTQHGDRFAVIVALAGDTIVGWASLNPFSQRCAHTEIADLSVYVARGHRGHGVGSILLQKLDAHAIAGGFRKIVLHALDGNEPGKRLYRKSGFTEVGVFKEHGEIDGRFVDVVAMEKLLDLP